MRFFSNDARESTDEQAQDERPDRVQSEPVAVPNQRPPSPWSDKPSTTDETAAADTDRRDSGTDTDSPDADGRPGRDDTDAPPFHEPSPQPTALGASTVGGAVAASAMANPQNDRWNATDRDSAADTGVGDDANVAAGDGVVTSSTSTYAGSTADTTPDSDPATRKEHDGPDGVVDLPLDDKTSTDTDPAPAGAVSARSGALTPDADRDANQDDSVTTFDDPDTAKTGALKDEGGFDDPQAVDPATDKPLDDSTADDETRRDPEAGSGTATGAATLKDDGGFDDPKAVDPATDTVLDAGTDAGTAPADSTPPAVVAVPVAAATAATPAADAAKSDRLFDPEDARSFQDRWRDVQLRFVDSPKDAAGDAAELVDEAVEKLSASLRAQRAGLNNDTDDTEQLRVQLRGYRDMLNRLLSL
jgi:hypothetical protein